MSYITRDELCEMFGQSEIARLEQNIAKNSEPPMSEDQIMNISINANIQASNEANSYIAAKYDLPLPSVPEQVKAYVGDISRYRLYKDRPTDEVFRRYELALSWFNKVASGRAILVFPVKPESGEGQPSVGSGIFVV